MKHGRSAAELQATLAEAAKGARRAPREAYAGRRLIPAAEGARRAARNADLFAL